jgi:hypothetical protein
MKKYSKTGYYLIITSLVLLMSCAEVVQLSVVEILNNSGKQWRIILLQREGGAVISASSYANVRYQFNSTGATPTTYQANGVGARGIAGEGDKPNYFSSSNQGSWEVQLGGKLVFDPKTIQESQVIFVEIPKANDKIVKLKWTVPEEVDKLIPTYIMHLERID